MRYWLTTQFPPEIGEQEGPDGVYVPKDRKKAADLLDKNDIVFIYQSKTGRRRVINNESEGKKKKIPRMVGRQGVIAIMEVKRLLKSLPDLYFEKYEDGTSIEWLRYAILKTVNLEGFISRERLCQILGYKSKYFFRGYGKLHSGLKELDQSTADTIIEEFKKNCPADKQKPKKHTGGFKGGGGEGPEHLELKRLVMNEPSTVLGEEGLTGIEMEYEYASGDKADVILQDKYGRFIAVEIEVNVTSGQIVGLLQAIKYKYMYAVQNTRYFDEIRAFLVARSISDDIKKLCKKYDVECFEVAS